MEVPLLGHVCKDQSSDTSSCDHHQDHQLLVYLHLYKCNWLLDLYRLEVNKYYKPVYGSLPANFSRRNFLMVYSSGNFTIHLYPIAFQPGSVKYAFEFIKRYCWWGWLMMKLLKDFSGKLWTKTLRLLEIHSLENEFKTFCIMSIDKKHKCFHVFLSIINEKLNFSHCVTLSRLADEVIVKPSLLYLYGLKCSLSFWPKKTWESSSSK